MEITVKVVAEKRLENLIDRLVAALESHQGGGCCKETDPAAELRAKMEAEKKQAEPEPEPEPKKVLSLDDVRRALSNYSAGDADKRAKAVEMLKEFHPSGKLMRIPPKDFGAVVAKLAEL